MMQTRRYTRSRAASTTTDGDHDMLTDSEEQQHTINSRQDSLRADSIDIDIDFSVTAEGGRTIAAHLVQGMGSDSHDNDNDNNNADHDDGLDFSVASSVGRTVEHFMEDQMQTESFLSGDAPDGASSSNTTTTTNIVPAVTATVSSPLSIPHAAKSPGRAIPLHHASSSASQQHLMSHPGSHDSSGSDFLSDIMNPAAGANIFSNAQLSHTPPNAFGTSYENNHFGKRQRSGSVSGRLRSASDLEEKGVIDRQQKGILKDLIICGDEDLQQALDQYEQGNPAVLENMIRSGALQGKAVPDLDLLGDLDLDFLTVHDIVGGDDEGSEAGKYPGLRSRSNSKAVKPVRSMPPPYNNPYPTKKHPVPGAHAKAPSSALVSPEYDDGIGELEFTGDFSDDEEGKDESPQHPPSRLQNHPGKQHRAASPIAEDKRLRSNSLFSALINDPQKVENHGQQYGQWMDRGPLGELMQAADHVGLLDIPADSIDDIIAASTGTTAVSQPISIRRSNSFDPDDLDIMEEDEDEELEMDKKPKKKGRRKSDSALLDRKMKAKIKQDIAEQKRREKQEKRDLREQEKLEKKEARQVAKAEKKKQKDKKKEAAAMAVEEEEKPVHVSGSGMPRSMSDPNLKSTRDAFGLVEIERPDGWIGAYSPESRKVRIDKFLSKRHKRVWTKTVKYDVRKNFADSRLRVKGRFVKKEDEVLMRDLMSLT